MKNDRLMALATVCSFGLLYVMMWQPIPDKNNQVFVFLLGLVCGFFFGGVIKQATPPGTTSMTSISEPIPPTVQPDEQQKGVQK